ncbi:MarR family transcriptional regulator [Nocardia asteroides]|uniref:MarR family transcriptional regulator n=1 Tax=Nocardia asteroides TaxID=1824 RepID=UPI001E38DF48|nr:helix-turn-helix domain-containing protein [Nocardia asteroides]UGT61985.1 winged helix-turn-helix domain-containing protein [Nocardia asteroides]
MKLGEEALPDVGGGENSAVLVVLADILDNSDCTVGEIATRTGLPQSAVSTAVARLRESGSVVARADPRDRRRTLLRRAEHASDRVAEVRASTVDDVLGDALGTADPEEISAVLHALELLSRRLIRQSGHPPPGNP